MQAHIGVIFESTNLYERLSAEENLRLFARLFGATDFNASEMIERVVTLHSEEASLEDIFIRITGRGLSG